MSLNGWYKTTYPNDQRLYQFIDDVQRLNITRNITTNIYTGYYMSNGIWVVYTSQSEMNTIWVANYAGANPLPGSTKK